MGGTLALVLAAIVPAFPAAAQEPDAYVGVRIVSKDVTKPLRPGQTERERWTYRYLENHTDEHVTATVKRVSEPYPRLDADQVTTRSTFVVPIGAHGRIKLDRCIQANHPVRGGNFRITCKIEAMRVVVADSPPPSEGSD